jgi:hypothetical protein
MDEASYAYLTAGVIVAYFVAHVVTRRFDPFAPTWLFLVGFAQVYVVQAIRYHDWAVSVRGKDLVAAADWRALWALLWFLLVYHLCPGRAIARILPRPPRRWSSGLVAVLAPLLVLWGLFSAASVIRAGDEPPVNGQPSFLSNFHFVMLVAGILLIVTGRSIREKRSAFLPLGIMVCSLYVLIWMFNGKRSHSLVGVLSTVCALYITRQKRPSWPVLLMTAFAGSLAVAVAIGWRNDREHARSLSGFASFLADFEVSRILQSLNVADGEEEVKTYETEEYGGFLLMMDTVPGKSDYDYGASYNRAWSTFIPRIFWPSKPLYGREAWVSAWIAGSELERDEDFTGPAIGILGAAQLNGGATGTVIVVGCVALLLRVAYDFFRTHADARWVQFWWAIIYFNAWFMVLNDDPLVWFYLVWGFCGLPFALLTWWANRRPGTVSPSAAAAPAPGWGA